MRSWKLPYARFVRCGTAAALFAVLLIPVIGCPMPPPNGGDPVVVAVTVDGDAMAGASVAATAGVEINDGSTLQGVAWTVESEVGATATGTDTETVTVTLPDLAAFKAALIGFLAEPPVSQEDLPPNVELPEGEFPGGLQDRFYVVGLNPFLLEETGIIKLTATVTTSSGSYTEEFDLHAQLPWKVTTGLRNVPIGIAVLLQGKTQATYNWSLSAPGGSTAALMDGTSQNPYFTPDVAGLYTVTVTDITGGAPAPVTLDIYAGTWAGAITGQDGDGRPLANNCTVCHNDNIAPDMFTDWAQTGHAEIFTDNLNTSTHYGESCFACHTVGFDPEVDNGGVDEAVDYQMFLDAGLLNNPGDNWTTVLNDFPDTAQLANIQCENCHGPQNGAPGMSAHTMGEPRVSISADVCASCHGEPLRHARYQQWQISPHANYELAIDEGDSGNCSRCHTANGFLAWLPILLDDDPATDPLDNVDVTWTAEETHPQTCVTCHDPHNIGTTTGVETDATIRISGDTPPLIAGFTATNVGRGAICMTCHNTRRGLRNDDTFDQIVADGDTARAPHGGAQTDVLMGQNAFFVDVGTRGSHSMVEDTCANCHMVQTPPPDVLAYNQGGTNHTFIASPEICAECHGQTFTAEAIQGDFTASAGELQDLIEEAILQLMAAQIAAGNTIDLNGEATVTDTADIADLIFGESHGRQAITVTMGGTTYEPMRVVDIDVVDGSDTVLGNLYDFADARLAKAGWNWNLLNNDGSEGVHNYAFSTSVLDASIDEMTALTTE